MWITPFQRDVLVHGLLNCLLVFVIVGFLSRRQLALFPALVVWQFGGGVDYRSSVLIAFQSVPQLDHAAHNTSKIAGINNSAGDSRGR